MILLILLIMTTLILGFSYMNQFDMHLGGKKENIIKDGLITELLVKAVNDPNPGSIIVHEDGKHITIDRTLIKGDGYGVCFWFPYKVMVLAKEFRERKIEEDFGYDVGYIRRFSKDYAAVKKLMVVKPENIELKQREKLNLKK